MSKKILKLMIIAISACNSSMVTSTEMVPEKLGKHTKIQSTSSNKIKLGDSFNLQKGKAASSAVHEITNRHREVANKITEEQAELLKRLQKESLELKSEHSSMEKTSADDYIKSLHFFQSKLNNSMNAVVKNLNEVKKIIDINQYKYKYNSLVQSIYKDNFSTMYSIILELKYIRYLLELRSTQLRKEYKKHKKSSNIEGLIEVRKQLVINSEEMSKHLSILRKCRNMYLNCKIFGYSYNEGSRSMERERKKSYIDRSEYFLYSRHKYKPAIRSDYSKIDLIKRKYHKSVLDKSKIIKNSQVINKIDLIFQTVKKQNHVLEQHQN